MKPKFLVALLAVTAAMSAAALATVAERYWITTATASVRVFPGLIDQVNEVTEIVVRTREGTATIRRVDGRWGMAERHDFPVQEEMVKRAVIGFAELEFTERKTARADRLARLHLEDVEAENAKSRLVALKDGSGRTMAELLVGRSRDGRIGGAPGLYVRKPGDPQAWFAPANFAVPREISAWLEQRIIHVAPNRVRHIVIRQPNGAKVELVRERPSDLHFTFVDLPEGAVLKGESVADEMGAILAAVDLADVKAQSEVDFAPDKAAHAEVTTFDGLVVKADVVRQSGKTWARFAAAAQPAQMEGDPPPYLKSAEEVKAEAEAINVKNGSWAYQLKDWHAEGLDMKLEKFLEKEEPLPAEGASGPPPPPAGGE